MNEKISAFRSGIHQPDFFEYWEGLGFFENMQMSLPREFFLLFEIARLIASQDKNLKAQNAIEELLRKDFIQNYDRDKSILINRLEKNAPISERMEIQHYKTIYDLRKALPRELTWDRRMFGIKLLTRTLLVQKYFESAGDRFKPISPTKNESGRDSSRFEQKFYLLLDRSRSMENRMRSFYSKSIVAEFLRRKLESNAKLYFRAFDSKPGALVKIEKKEDYSSLIEKVIFTTTGGTSTNMQAAIFQAVEDINYDKEMLDAEILVVTDGLVHDLDIVKMKDKLKDIKLNFLKIGLDLAEPDGYEIKRVLSEAGYNFDPFSVNIKEIKKKLESSDKAGSLSRIEQRIYEYMLECSEKIINDLKVISHKFIEIEDINPDDLLSLNKNIKDYIDNALERLLQIDLNDKSIQEQAVVYKKAYFLSQYIEFLMKSGNAGDKLMLRETAKELSSFKQKMLANPYLFKLVMETGVFDDDNKAIKTAKKGLKKRLRETARQDRTLSREEIKNAQMIFSMSGGSAGSGNMWQFFRILLIKLSEKIKNLFH